MLLTGTFNRALDEKLRIAIPKHLRDSLPCPPGGGLYVTPGTDGSLTLYTEAAFQSLGQRLAQSPPTRQDVRAFSRLFYGQAQYVELDGQGRIRIPPELATLAKLQNEVVLWEYRITWRSGHWSVADLRGRNRAITTKLPKRHWEEGVNEESKEFKCPFEGSSLVETRSPVAIGHLPAILHRPPSARCVSTSAGERMPPLCECGISPSPSPRASAGAQPRAGIRPGLVPLHPSNGVHSVQLRKTEFVSPYPPGRACPQRCCDTSTSSAHISDVLGVRVGSYVAAETSRHAARCFPVFAASPPWTPADCECIITIEVSHGRRQTANSNSPRTDRRSRAATGGQRRRQTAEHRRRGPPGGPGALGHLPAFQEQGRHARRGPRSAGREVAGECRGGQQRNPEPLGRLHGLFLRHIRIIREGQAFPRIIFSDEALAARPDARPACGGSWAITSARSNGWSAKGSNRARSTVTLRPARRP